MPTEASLISRSWEWLVGIGTTNDRIPSTSTTIPIQANGRIDPPSILMGSVYSCSACLEGWGGAFSFEPTSSSRLVISTSPRICVHSETMLPTTCPQRLLGRMARNAITQPMPVTSKNNVSECSRRNSFSADGNLPLGCLLSAEPFSYRYLVMTTVTTTPVQSAMALPKNDPRWVSGFDRQ